MQLIDEDRFWSKVNKTEKCWLWCGAKQRHGYEQVRAAGSWLSAHRVSYEMRYGKIPYRLVIDHICHVKNCVRPEHLQAVSSKQNQENKRGPSVTNTSGVRGVYWDSSVNKWHAQVGHNGRRISAGRFLTLPEAEAAVIAKRNELHTNNLLDRKTS